jgi:tRNA-dihydrouridine synthase B
VARKHISWYTRGLIGSSAFRQAMNRLDSMADQLSIVSEYFAQAERADRRLRYEIRHLHSQAEERPQASRLAA